MVDSMRQANPVDDPIIGSSGRDGPVGSRLERFAAAISNRLDRDPIDLLSRAGSFMRDEPRDFMFLSDPSSTPGLSCATGQIMGIWRLGEELTVRQPEVGSGSRLFAAQPADSQGSPRFDYVLKTASGDTSAARQILATVAAAGITHPNLIATLDASTSGTSPYVVMPRLEALPLDQRIDGMSAFTLPVALWMTRQVAQASLAMHESGWIHGDIKPANVLVDDRGHVTLIDLGFAARIHSPMPALFRGTPDYASPELIDGSTAALPGMDVFAIGKMLWHSLTKIVDADSMLVGNTAELVEAMLEPDPSDRPSCGTIVSELLALEIDSLGSHIVPARRRAA
ncbi:MAG: protein kinase [Planctomycetota bacterium]